ncbi:hypothetical protein F1880_001469 [Penicillium rolfsii]|nr:hypothetical protein F1880_001469 [Penicillium rolfsii]
MSSGRSENDPSFGHQGASAGQTHHEQVSSSEESSNQLAAIRLAYYRSNTSKLLEFIRQSDPELLDRFISLVRSGLSHDDVFAVLDQLSSGNREQSGRQTSEKNAGSG